MRATKCVIYEKEQKEILEKLLKILNINDDNNILILYNFEKNQNKIDEILNLSEDVFYTPSIIYGIDYNYSSIDVFCFINKNHLNPLQIYQMISRARKQELVHIYINEKLTYSKYKSVDDVIRETENYEKNFNYLQPL